MVNKGSYTQSCPVSSFNAAWAARSKVKPGSLPLLNPLEPLAMPKIFCILSCSVPSDLAKEHRNAGGTS
jgi:hypothetical protein